VNQIPPEPEEVANAGSWTTRRWGFDF